jgi:hypothetical protein
MNHSSHIIGAVGFTIATMHSIFLKSQEVPVFDESERVVERLLYPEQFEVVDWDGDGDLDVFAAGNGNNRLAFFEGTGTGDLSWMQLLPESAMADDWNDVQAVDWDADGRMDLVVCEEGGLQWLAQLEDGTMAVPVQLRPGSDPFRLDIRDVNGDGHLDVSYTDKGSNEAVLMHGMGGGVVAEEVLVEPLNAASVTALADWNHDGYIDWLFGSYNWGELYVRLGDGMGSYASAALVADFGKLSGLGVMLGTEGEVDRFFVGVEDTYVLEWHPDGTPADTLGLLAKAQQFDFGDLNGDGILDIAVAAQSSSECGIIYGNDSGGFNPEIVELNVASTMDVAIADLDGDGVNDLVTASRTKGQVGFRPGSASDPLQEWSYTPLVEGLQYVRNAACGDVNGDGLDDVLVMVQGPNLYSGGPEYLHVALAQPDGFFDVSYVSTGTYFGYEVQLADYDGDGDLDAAVSDYNGDRVIGLRNNGEGEFAVADTLIESINGCDDLTWVDMDGDGDDDLVAAAWQGSDVMISLNDGTGGLALPLELSNPGSRCEAAGAGDFNGDGLMDIAACFENSGDVRIWMRTIGSIPEDLTFDAPQVLALPSAQDLGVADWDGDGDLDVFGVGYNETDVQVFENVDGTFNEALPLGMGNVNGALGLTVGDADGDGVAEAIVSEYGGARTRLFHGATGQTVELFAGNGPQNAVFGDFDGDGDQDVAMAFYALAEVRWTRLVSGMQPPICFGLDQLTAFLAAYGCQEDCEAFDYDFDGAVTVFDFLEVLRMYGTGC